MYMYMYLCVCVYVYVFVCTHTLTDTQTHTHTHTHTCHGTPVRDDNLAEGRREETQCRCPEPYYQAGKKPQKSSS